MYFTYYFVVSLSFYCVFAERLLFQPQHVKKIAESAAHLVTGAAEQGRRSAEEVIHSQLENKKNLDTGKSHYNFYLRASRSTCDGGKDSDSCKESKELCNVEVSHDGETELVEFVCLNDKKPILKEVGMDNGKRIFKDETELLSLYSKFKEQYDKDYGSRKADLETYFIFRDNMHKAQLLQQTDLGTATYGATQFADIPEDVFKKHYTSGKWKDPLPNPTMKEALIPDDTPPDEFDWRDHDAVTEVKNQGSCGSCWAFSTTGNIEGQWAIAKKKLVSLSEQELVDCDKLDDGCNGGLPTNAYQEIMRLGGLETETDYPYEGSDEKCAFVKSDVKVYINGSLNISKNEDDMKAWLYKNGPISIGINANAMQFYFGGVSHPWKIFCEPGSLDHGVLITGYGIYDGWLSKEPYWAVKNSWGASWGEKGYYLVYRGAGVCGLNEMPTSATVDK